MGVQHMPQRHRLLQVFLIQLEFLPQLIQFITLYIILYVSPICNQELEKNG